MNWKQLVEIWNSSGEKILRVTALLLILSAPCQAQNSHDLELGANIDGAGVAQARQQEEEEGQPVIIPHSKAQMDTDKNTTAETKTVEVKKLTVTTDNEVGGGIEAKDGGQVSIGDAGLIQVKAESVTIDTKNKIQGKIEVGQGDTFKLGTVNLENHQGQSVKISSDNSLTGNVKTKQGSTVSLGNTNVGGVAEQAAYMQNRGSLVDSARPNGLISNHDNTALGSKGVIPSEFDHILSKEEAANYLDFIKISEATYKGNLPIGHKIGDWVKVDDSSNMKWQGTLGDKFLLSQSGFHAVVYVNENTKEIVVAFEGTNPISPDDVNTDLDGVLSPVIPYAYQVGYFYAKAVADSNPDYRMITTGHSLGGGMAQYASGKLASDNIRTKSIPISSAGLWAPAISDIFGKGNINKVQANTEIVHIRRAGDRISGTGESSQGFAPVATQDLPWGNWTYIELPSGIGSDHEIKDTRKDFEKIANGENIATRVVVKGR